MIHPPKIIQPSPNKAADIIKAKVVSPDRLERRRQYQREYQRKRRARLKIISITIPEEHRTQIVEAAQNHSLSLPQFLIQSTLHNLNKAYLVPNPGQIDHLQQLLSLWHTDMQRLIKLTSDADLTYTLKLIQQRVSTLENQVHSMLTKPLSVPTPQNDH